MLCWPENLRKGISSKTNHHILKTNLHAKSNLAEMWQFNLKSCPNLGSLEGRNEHFFFAKMYVAFLSKKLTKITRYSRVFTWNTVIQSWRFCSKVLACKWRIRTYSFKCIRVLSKNFLRGRGWIVINWYNFLNFRRYSCKSI